MLEDASLHAKQTRLLLLLATGLSGCPLPAMSDVASEVTILRSCCRYAIFLGCHWPAQNPELLRWKDKFRIVDVSPIFSEAVRRLMHE